MQPGHNPFDPGRAFAGGRLHQQIDQLDTNGPPPPPPPPPTYQQHFQNVRFGVPTLNESPQQMPTSMSIMQMANNPSVIASRQAPATSFQQLNTSSIFGGPAALTNTARSVPVFPGFGDQTPMTKTMAAPHQISFGQLQPSTHLMQAPQQLFNINSSTLVSDSTTSRPAAASVQFTAAGNLSSDQRPIFPGGTSSASKSRLVALNRATPLFDATSSVSQSTQQPTVKNPFEKRFGFGTTSSSSTGNIFGNVAPRDEPRTVPFSFTKESPSKINVDNEQDKTGPVERTTKFESATAARPIAAASESDGDENPNKRLASLVTRGPSSLVSSSLASGSPALRSSGSDQSAVIGSRSSQRSLAGSTSAGSALHRRSRLSSREGERHTEVRSRRLSERSGGAAGDLLRLPHDEIEHLTSIVVKGVPVRLNNKRRLLQHFGKYGVVQKINCQTRKEIAIIYFTDHEGARKAKENGAEMESGKAPVLILWGRMATPVGRPARSLLSATTVAVAKPAAAEKITSRTSKERRSSTTRRAKDKKSEDVDDDVRAELHSMRHDDDLDAPMVLSRTRDKDSSTFLSPTKQKSTRRASPHPPSQDSNETFQALSNMQTVTAGDRCRVLVARDKNLRQSVKKPSDLASARAVVGTCPDMCPEKERYMREDRGQLHPYEVLVGIGSDESSRTGEFPRIDHRKAIKEYSRSSADQEEPLPHELRPPNVLARTMDYLVCNVLDLLDRLEGANAAAEWYDFVWNRTRGIRKDITQQHLCDQTSVALVEKCTRFHIQCAERLCEEDMSVFDQKINNENLTKCLQTLKHFYVDLQVKGELCPNECEFRAYDILLNLNEGDTLREVLCLRPDIRESDEVRFALRLFDNLNSNNYVAFFKNVRRAPYLTACILQRYFTQVRERALKVTLKAYCPPNHSGQFPIRKFVQMLAFENQAEAEEFLGYHSLSVEGDYLVWDKAGLSYPESAIPTRRACSLIESKRCCTAGEVVNGGQLPPNPLDTYNPHTSFDQQGYLKKLTDDEPAVQEPQHQSLSSESSVDPTVVLEPFTSGISDEQKRRVFTLQLNKAIEDEASDIAVEVLTAMIGNVCRPLVEEVHFGLALMNVASQLLTNVMGELIRSVAEETLRECKSVELRIRKQREIAENERQRQSKEEAELEALNNVLDEVVSCEMQRLASNIMREERDLEWQRCTQRSSETLSSELVDQWVAQFVSDVSIEVHSFEAEYRRATLSRISKKLDGWRAVVFYNKWRLLVTKRKRTRRSMEMFPSSTNMGGQRGIGSMAEVWAHGRLQSPLEIATDQKRNKSLLDLGVHRKNLEICLKDTPLDLLGLAKNNIRDDHVRGFGWSFLGTYWKLAVLIPTDEESVFSDWLRHKLGAQSPRRSARTVSSDSWIELLDIKSSIFKGRVYGVCAKAFYGNFASNESIESLVDNRELQGTRGLVIMLPAPLSSSPSASYELYWAGEYRRLCRLISCMPPLPAVPVLIVCPWRLAQSSIVQDGLHLENLVNHHLISTYRVVEIADDMREELATTQLLAGMEWLSKACPPVPDLKQVDLATFVEECVHKFFSSVVSRAVRNSERGSLRLHPPPDLLVVGCNYAISFAAKIASSSSLKDVSWPPTETLGCKEPYEIHVNWNTEENLSTIRNRAERFHLPPFPHEIMDCTTLDQIKDTVRSYVDVATPPNKTGVSKAIVVTRIQRILDRSFEAYASKGYQQRPSCVIPWIDVIHEILNHLFCCIASEIDVTYVVYDPGFAQTFDACKEWMWAVDQALTASENARVDQEDVLTNSKYNSFLVKEEQGLKRKLLEDPFAEPPKEKEVYLACRRLSAQLETEKQRNAEFEAYLERSLKSDKINA